MPDGERPPSLDPHDPRRRGPIGRARRRVGYGLVLVSAVLTVWTLRTPAPPPSAPAPTGCAADAPAEATPVALPQPEPETFAALVGGVVCFTHDLVVTEAYDLGRFGELLLADTRLYGPNTGLAVERPQLHVVRLSAPARAEYAWPLPWGLEPGGVRVGDAVVLPFGRLVVSPRGGYALEPSSPPEFAARNPRPTSGPAPVGDVRVAAFNLGSYFVTLGERGARDAAELERQTAKLVAALVMLDADVIAVAEVERGDDALRALAAALDRELEAAGVERRYRAVPEAPGTAGDLVRQGFLYDPARVEVVSLARDPAPIHLRPPQALTARVAGAPRPLVIVAVHHRSRAGCPASGDVDRGYGCWNLTRTRQSEATLAFARSRAAAAGGADVLVVGDVNAHRFEPPLAVFDEADDGVGWEVLTDRVPPEEAYSFVFFGRSAALDHAIASADVAERVTQVVYLAINADEAPLSASRVPPGIPQAYAPNAFRSSDHDPVVVDLRLAVEEDGAIPAP